MSVLRVRACAGATSGRLTWPGGTCRCALGRGGITEHKREGDGVTPAGRFPLETVYYRADRGPRPPGYLPATAIAPDWGWGDDPQDQAGYNRLCQLPYAFSHERLWRNDHVYDLLVVLGYNRAPTVAGAGSAIFLHLARTGLAPTAGCVAVPWAAMIAMLGAIPAASVIDIAQN